jgi:NarL family two-component system response regulator LiaR
MGAESEPRTLGAKISVLVVEDDYFAQRAMASLLMADDIELTGVVGTSEEGIESARRERPRVALIDLRLQGDNRAGIEVIRAIRAISPETACCIITGADARGDLYADAFYAGAQGYSRKGDTQNSDLREVARRLARGEWVVDSELAAKFATRGARVDQWRARAIGGEEPHLSERELEVLALVAQQLPTQEIADRMFITVNTVKTHIGHIIAKLQVQNRDQAVLYAVLKGYFTAPNASE